MNSLGILPFIYKTNIYNKTEDEINNLASGIYDIFEGNETLGGIQIDWSALVVFRALYLRVQMLVKDDGIYVRYDKSGWSEWKIIAN